MSNLPMKLPDKVETALLHLSARARDCVMAYMDRGSPAYGNKSRALREAGYAPSTSATAVFNQPRVMTAIADLRAIGLEASKETMDGIKALAPEASDELMAQLRVGRDLEMIDPTDVFGDELDGVADRHDADRLRSIAAHNATLAKVMKERREAAKIILEYSFGTPEQRVRMTKDTSEDELEAMLGKMSRKDFERLGRILFAETQNGPEDEDDQIPVIEAELLDE